VVLPTSDTPEVSILIVLYNSAELTFEHLKSLAKAITLPCEVIIVDNASSDRTHALLERMDDTRLQPGSIRIARNLLEEDASIGAVGGKSSSTVVCRRQEASSGTTGPALATVPAGIRSRRSFSFAATWTTVPAHS
jgi:hypothetical protein